VECHSGKYFGAGTALRQISLATGGKITPKRSGKSRCTRSVDPRSVYFLAQIAPKCGIWHQKPKKIIRGCQREEASPSRAHPQHGYTPWPCTGAQAPSLLGPRSRKPFPQIKIYHYTPWWHSTQNVQLADEEMIKGNFRQMTSELCDASSAVTVGWATGRASSWQNLFQSPKLLLFQTET